MGRRSAWTTSEEARLRALYPSATQEELVAALPGRTWSAVRVWAKRLGVRRPRPGKHRRVPGDEEEEKYCAAFLAFRDWAGERGLPWRPALCEAMERYRRECERSPS